MLYGSQLDLAALRTVIAELLDAIGETERLAAFDRLVERTGLPVIPKAIGKRKNLP